MNIEEMIWNGASDEEIQKALAQIKADKAKQEEALRAEEKKSKVEELKREARAYAINALAAYSEAFDLGEFDEEDVKKLEELLIQMEALIPLYMKLSETFDMENLDPDMLKGLFGM